MVESFCVVFECYGDLLTRIIDVLDEACDTRLEAVNIAFDQPFPVEEARSLLKQAPGVELIEDVSSNRFPMPTDVTGRDPVAIGRIRQDISDPNALELWLCGDQIRKGAALNAVQIAELLIQS